jgi:parallel beta helix pectate lyase-like protein
VTVQPAAGASASIGYVNLQHVSHLHFSGASGSLSVAGGIVDQFNTLPNCSDHITFDYLRFTSGFDIFPRCAAMAITVDHDNLNNLVNTAAGDGRINVQALDQGPAADQGITISNSTFNGGCSKGIQILGGAYGVQVLNNEFAYLPDQDTCNSTTGVHIGGVQIYGGEHAHLKGNYFHDNGSSAGGLSEPIGDHDLIEDNVWVCTCIYPWSIQAGVSQGSIYRHNTFAGGGGLHFYAVSGWPNASGNRIYDNVFTDAGNGITWDSVSSGWGTQDHNLNSGLSGTGDITGKPLWSGGSSPTSYAGYHLAAGSPGKGAASDGTDMGIR